jgi:tRNA threonylcarbamoyladenosine biosynthesis protein TsaE
MELTFSLTGIREAAASFWTQFDKLSGARVIAFHGQMGAGKTTFIHALCDVKQVKDVVGSPTFSIINQYNYTEEGKEKRIFHIDLYRLKDEEEAIQAGIEDCFYSGHICLVEWPDRAGGLLPENTLHVELTIVDSSTRRLNGIRE